MPTRFLLHTILLISATSGVYFWLTSPLTPYTLQLVAVLVLLYFSSHWYYSHNSKFKPRDSITLDLTLLTSMILLLVTETGALASPLFFLLFFLCFAVALLYEIEATLVLTGTLILYFMFLPGTDLANLADLSVLIGLVMITPLAIFTGHQYELNLENQKNRTILTRHLGKIESDSLLFLSLNLKTTLLKSLDSLSLIIPTTSVKKIRHNLEILYKDLKVLYRTSVDLEQSIDRETD